MNKSTWEEIEDTIRRERDRETEDLLHYLKGVFNVEETNKSQPR